MANLKNIVVVGCELAFGQLAGTTVVEDSTVTGTIVVNPTTSVPLPTVLNAYAKADGKLCYTSIDTVVTITDYNGMAGALPALTTPITGSSGNCTCNTQPVILEGDYTNISVPVSAGSSSGTYTGVVYIKKAGQEKAKCS